MDWAGVPLRMCGFLLEPFSSDSIFAFAFYHLSHGDEKKEPNHQCTPDHHKAPVGTPASSSRNWE
jgi:hypothetical protein